MTNSDKRQKAIQMFIVTKKVEGCTENTIHYYLGTLRRFFNEINQHLEEITADQIRYYLAIRSTRDKLSKTSQDNELRVLKSFFKWCSGEEYISRNPTEKTKTTRRECVLGDFVLIVKRDPITYWKQQQKVLVRFRKSENLFFFPAKKPKLHWKNWKGVGKNEQ